MEIDLSKYKAICFNLDNVLYPEKDYLLQVYYLFAQFMEYTEQMDAAAITDFLKNEFETNGAEEIFSKVQSKFNIPHKYEHNFNLLHNTARLPLKLLLFQSSLSLMQQAVAKGLEVIILVDGNPEVQINKIKQIEWNGLEKDIKIYFTVEFGKDRLSAKNNLIEAINLTMDEVCWIDVKNP